MHLYDVNVLVNAHRVEAPHHATTRKWLERELAGPSTFMMSELVLCGFLRIVTHPRIFRQPTPLHLALNFIQQIRSHPLCIPINPGPRHFDLFTQLCQTADARGNLVPDAYLAALAIENGCKLLTFDRDFARFQNLSWATPTQKRNNPPPPPPPNPQSRRTSRPNPSNPSSPNALLAYPNPARDIPATPSAHRHLRTIRKIATHLSRAFHPPRCPTDATPVPHPHPRVTCDSTNSTPAPQEPTIPNEPPATPPMHQKVPLRTTSQNHPLHT